LQLDVISASGELLPVLEAMVLSHASAFSTLG